MALLTSVILVILVIWVAMPLYQVSTRDTDQKPESLVTETF